MGNLLPDRHPNRDFFILDVSDAAPKDDMASMEHPVFSLSVKPDMRELDYSHDGKRIVVVPSGKGLATIMDKDILLYCISKLVHQLNAGDEISPWVELSAHEVMVATNWRTNRESYQRFEDALDRLRGTTIKTNIKTGDHTQIRGFGLIDEYEITRRDEETGEVGPFGRMTRVRIKVSDWTFRAVQGMEVLTINPQYFRLRRPLERRIYELARKHVGDQGRPFRIGLDKLQRKVGSNSPEKKFKFFVKQIAQDGHIPDYDIEVTDKTVCFTVKRPGFSRAQSAMDFGIPTTPAPTLLDKARRAAPGLDVYALYEDWRSFASTQKEAPRSLDAAFLGFCKKRSKSEC